MLRTYHVEPVRVRRPRSEHALSVWFALGYWASDKKSASDRHSLFALFKCQHKKAQSRAGSAWVCLYLSVLTTVLLALLQRRSSEEHTSELQSLMRISYAVFCLK